MALEEDKCGAVFAFVPGCQCVYSAVCNVISQSVSYDLPEPDEVLSTTVGRHSVKSANQTCTILSGNKCIIFFLLL